MAQKQTQTVTINGVEYGEDDLTNEQKIMVNHVADLERKIGSAQFNLDQLHVGRNAFMEMLTKSLAQKEDEA